MNHPFVMLARRVSTLTGPNRGTDLLIFSTITGIISDANAPHYTASVEDAAKLVPESLNYEVSGGSSFDSWAKVYNPTWDQSYGTRRAATPALALAAAALYAMAQLEGIDLSICEEPKPSPRPVGSRPERY